MTITFDTLSIDDLTESPAVQNGLWPFTDAKLAEVFAREIEGRYVHVKRMGGWFRWDGQRWRNCDQEDVREVARDWTIRQHLDALDAYRDALTDAGDDQAAKQVMDDWQKYQAKPKLDAIVSLASGIVTAEPGNFDSDPDLLNCANGVIDLRTGELLPHDPKRMMTKITPVEYKRGAKHDDWETALTALPADVLGWYQIRLGQAITGHPSPRDLMVVQQGTGNNGKSTIMGGVEAALGDYYLAVSDRALLADARSVPTEVADFHGARFAVVEELPEGKVLNVNQLKKLVGTKEITARHLYHDNFTFTATHCLFVDTNYQLLVNETDHGTWRRLAMVVFPYTYRDKREDVIGPNDRLAVPGLRERIWAGKKQHEAILAWLVEGAVCWYANGVPDLPKQVDKDTDAWRCTSDRVLAYFTDRLVPDRDSHVISTELYTDFKQWLEGRGHSSWTVETFSMRFDGHEEIAANHIEKKQIRKRDGLSRRHSSGDPPGRYMAYLGVRFRNESTGECPW